MGCVTSCFRVHDDGGNDEGHRSVHPSRCTCLGCLTRQLLTVVFRREQMQISSSAQVTPSIPSASAADGSSISDAYRSPPRPLPYDDPRFSHLYRRDKALSQSHEESETVRRNISDKLKGSDHKGESKVGVSESSLKHPFKDATNGMTYIFSSSEDEDVCPTCLEEYTSENPRITLQCSHDFHLSCIYEWMERSELCPVCGKVMLFNETN